MWPNIEVKPTRSPWWKTGTSTMKSLRWLIAPAHAYGIVLQDDVARLQVETALLEHVGNVGAELADDHLPLGVADHREFVVLLADHRRHGRAEQHRIHLVAGIAQRVLDQIERDSVEPAGFRAAPAELEVLRRAPPSARAAEGRAAPAVRCAPRSPPHRRTSRRSCATPLRSRGCSAAPFVAIGARRAELHLRGAVDRKLAQHRHRSRARSCARRLPMTSASRTAR